MFAVSAIPFDLCLYLYVTGRRSVIFLIYRHLIFTRRIA